MELQFLVQIAIKFQIYLPYLTTQQHYLHLMLSNNNSYWPYKIKALLMKINVKQPISLCQLILIISKKTTLEAS